MAGPIVVSILGDTRDLTGKLGRAESRLGKWGKAAGVTAVAGLTAAAGAAGAFGVAAVKSASDAQQSLGASETVFGRFADQVIKKSNQAAKSYGLSANEYRENANLIGSLFKNQGVSMDQLAGKTDSMIGTASDLAATFGGTTKSAVEALGSAFKGEFDPLERYGISIKQSTINAELAANGQDKLTGAALKAAQQQATTKLVMDQGAASLGAFGRESNTLAHQQQVLGAQWDDLKAKAGTALLPVLTSLATVVSTHVFPALKRLGPPLQAVGDFITTKVVPAIRTHLLPVARAWATSFKANILPALKNLLPPLGSLFRVIGRVIVVVLRLTPPVIRVASVISGILFRAVGIGIRVLGGLTSKIIDMIGWFVRAGRRVVTFVGTVVRWVGSLPDKLTKAAQGMVRIGWDLMLGMARGVREKAGDVIATIKTWVIDRIPGPIKRAFGIASPSKVFKGFGRNLIEGLVLGIKAEAPTLDSTLQKVTGGALTASSKGSRTRPRVALNTAGSGAAGGSATHYSINVSPSVTASPADVGRAVVRAIEAYQAVGGRRSAGATL